jgi:hypothetical protein
MTLDNHPTHKYGFWIKPFVIMLATMLTLGCTKHELIDLPTGNVEGSIVFRDIDYNNYLYPGGSFQIKAQCDANTYWASSDTNGSFSFSNLPYGGYSFSLLSNNKELMSIDHCSFLGGGEPSSLNFWFRIQPDTKSINYHFEIIRDTLWIFGQVELDGTPPIESNKIMFYSSFPPDNIRYWNRVVPFDMKSKQIKFMWSKVYDLKSGDYINSYIYKKYREYGAVFTNYVIKQNPYVYEGSYDDLNLWYKTASDSTNVDKFIIQ